AEPARARSVLFWQSVSKSPSSTSISTLLAESEISANTSAGTDTTYTRQRTLRPIACCAAKRPTLCGRRVSDGERWSHCFAISPDTRRRGLLFSCVYFRKPLGDQSGPIGGDRSQTSQQRFTACRGCRRDRCRVIARERHDSGT